jgi:peptidyl-prolyl cis-trans isomerase B (cyclophilin B)
MNPQVNLNTSAGSITIELDAERAPQTTANFLQYVEDGHFNGTVFHRVIPGFMIQGGGFDKTGSQKPTRQPIRNEAANGLKNASYTVAMARTSDPHSASAQFFINVANNDFLNHSAPSGQGWGYAVFGKIIAGQSIVDKIAATKTRTRAGHQDWPVDDIVIERAELVAAGQ